MDEWEAGKYWDENAEQWTFLARKGYDVYRDFLNTPAFLSMLPDIRGYFGLDIGCGEGYNTRMLASRGAKLEAIDISPIFIAKAKEAEDESPAAIGYQVASATQLPFADNTFDFATAFMSLMDIPNMEIAIKEAFRVLKPGAFFQFSIIHPCFFPPHRKNLRDATGRTYALEVGDYFKRLDGWVDEWLFTSTPRDLREKLRNFRVPVFNRTLSDWLNALAQAGFVIEKVNEPRPADQIVKDHPMLQDAQVVSYFLHIRARKPGS